MIADQQNMEGVILPGSTIGIFGSGQLGKMMTIAAKEMGYRVHVYSPALDSPAGQVADLEIQASYHDLEAVERFARQVDVITLEFENVPAEALEAASLHAPVHPGVKALRTTQNRALEKQFLLDHQIPTCEFRVVRSLSDLQAASREIMPAVLKTTANGYDGKGQVVIRSADEIAAAWQSLNTDEAILEEFVEFEYEFSIVAARNSAGLLAAFPSIRNEHHNQILDVSTSPSGLEEALNTEATKVAYELMVQLDAVGVMCVEFFYRNGAILVNEIAPRPHNSGHLTIEGHWTSQFEQHIRAICGLMLGSTRQTIPVASVNLLGDQWNSGDPKWHLAMSMPSVKLHLYGKGDPQPGRKMGHLTAIANSVQEAREQVLAAKKLLMFDPAGANLRESKAARPAKTNSTSGARH